MKIAKMDRKSSEFLTFLLVTFCLWCGFAFGADERCNFDEKFESCVDNRKHLNEPMNVEKLFGIFRQNASLQDACSRVNNMKRCINDRTANCRADANSRYKAMWPKVEKGIYYVCTEKFDVFSGNKACLQRQEVVSSAVAECQNNIKHTAHRRYARHSCSDVREAAVCVKRIVSSRCNAEVAAAMERMTSLFLAVMDPSHDCEHSDSGATFGVSRLVLSSALILAGVLRWNSG